MPRCSSSAITALLHSRRSVSGDHNKHSDLSTKQEREFSTASNATMARRHVEQSRPVRAIFWPDAEDIDKLSNSLDARLVEGSSDRGNEDSRESKVDELRISESGTSQEEASLLENSKRRVYGADAVGCDWEGYYMHQIEEIRQNGRGANVSDNSQRCRDFCSLLQTKQKFWNDLLMLKHIKSEAATIKSSFMDFQNSKFDLRLSRCLEWRARRAVEGDRAWRKTINDTIVEIMAGPILSVLSREIVGSLPSRSDDLNFFKSLHEALVSALFCDDDPSCYPQSCTVDGSIAVDEQILLYLSDISLLMEVVRREKEASELETTILAHLEAKQPFVCGPMGESPIHTCFLLGLREFGYKVIERFYPTPEALSVGYRSDIALWKGGAAREPEWEDGLYTGETCLHMAIVQEDLPLVEHLLDRHISLRSAARGLFFQPRLIRQRIVGLSIWRLLSERWAVVRAERGGRPVSFAQMLGLRFEGGEEQRFTGWELLRAWAFGLVFRSHLRGVTSLNLVNRYSACYYGEYPLSFAASVGSTAAASMLYAYHRVRAAARHPVTAEERREAELQRARLDGWVVPADPSAPHDAALLVNAADSCGNTALHMAVLHRRTDMIDWLLGTPEGRAGLEILNHDGLTPFTLAARLGEVDVFHHMLDRHLSETMWVFGKVRMRKVDLYQVDTFRIWKEGDDAPDREPAEEAPPRPPARGRAPCALPDGAWLAARRALGRFVRQGVRAVRRGLQETAAFSPRGQGLHGRPLWRSAVEVIVHHEVDAFAKDPLFNAIIEDKWARFGAGMHLCSALLPHAALVASFAAFVVLRTDEIRAAWPADPAADPPADDRCARGALARAAALASAIAHGGDRQASAGLHAALALLWAPWLVVTGWRHRRLRSADMDVDGDSRISLREVHMFLFKNLRFLLGVGAGLALAASAAARVACADTAELDALAAASLLLFTGALLVLLPYQYVGALVITIFKMLVGDVARFVLVYLLLFGGFALGTCLLYQRSARPPALHGDDEAGSALLHMAFVSLGDSLGAVMDEYGAARSPAVALAFYLAWVVLSLVLMLNLLVAMMGKTFMDEMEDTHRHWVFPFAALVLRYESMLDSAQREAHRYGSRDGTGRQGQGHVRFYDVRVAQLEE